MGCGDEKTMTPMAAPSLQFLVMTHGARTTTRAEHVVS